MKSYLQLGGAAYLLNLYNWLGDPALKTNEHGQQVPPQGARGREADRR